VFIDASALVAIMMAEPEAPSLTARLRGAERRLVSAITVFETVLAIARLTNGDVMAARQTVERFLQRIGAEFVPVGDRELVRAIDAFDRFGKGRDPARLNMGDCFAYACAKTNAVPLLFKGDDFGRTDVVPA
jgi:ribonuclease VapC